MSSLASQLDKVIETAELLAAKLSEITISSQKEFLKSTTESIISIAERIERLVRTTSIDGLSDKSSKLELSAIKLWNSVSIAIKSERDLNFIEHSTLRYFSCLLCSIQAIVDTSIKAKFRVMSCINKTFKYMIEENGNSEMVTKIRELADKEYTYLDGSVKEFNERQKIQLSCVKAEFFVMKMHLSIAEHDVGSARLYEEKSGLKTLNWSPESEPVILECMRLIYNSSFLLYQSSDHDNTIYFLNRAISLWDSRTEEALSVKSSMLSLLVQSCFEIRTPESLNMAEKLIQDMDQDTIEYYKFELRQRKLCGLECEDVMMRMLMNVTVSSHFKEVLKLINELSTDDPQSAIRCFDYMLINSVDPNSDHEYIEMIAIAAANIFIKEKGLPFDILHPKIITFLELLEKTLIKSISRKTSSACVTLFWTRAKSEFKNNQFQNSIEWFQIALHRVIDINKIDKAKVQRSLQNCYLQTGQYDKVLEIYNQMEENEKRTILTKYLMFKAYSYLDQKEELLKCIQDISVSDDKKVVPLLALCTINLKTSTRVTIECMLILLKKLHSGIVAEVSVPLTLRCVIELILKESESGLQDLYLEPLWNLTHEAYTFASESQHIPNYKFTTDELKWFSALTFNIARDCLLREDYLQGQLFSDLSVKFNSLIKDDISSSDSYMVKIWRFRATIIEMMCISKSPEANSLNIWQTVRQHALNLRLSIEELSIVLKRDKSEFAPIESEWRQCLSDATIFQFEAELKLGNWAAAEKVVEESINYKIPEFESTIVNIVIEDKVPDRVKASVLSQIVSRNMGEKTIGSSLVRWIRLLLKYSTEEKPIFKVLEQLTVKLSTDSSQFPPHEVEWIASTCWNNGVTQVFNKNKTSGKAWCDFALKLARFINERFENTLNKLWEDLIAD